MRPCNQCRQPVENGVYICNKCVQYNDQHNLDAPQPVQANTPDDLEAQSENPYDGSLRQVANAFYLIIALLGALIGLAVFGSFQSFVIGGLIGLVSCSVFLRIVFAGM